MTEGDKEGPIIQVNFGRLIRKMRNARTILLCIASFLIGLLISGACRGSQQRGEGPIEIRKFQETNKKFLFPILIYGPNNQYLGFKEAAILAKYTNRTLVLPRFLVHHTNRNEVQKSFPFDKVFDEDQIANYVEVIPLDSFRAFTDSLEEVWTFETTENCQRRVAYFLAEQGIRSEIPVTIEIPGRLRYIEDIEKSFGNREAKFASVSCIFHGVTAKNELTKVSQYLQFSMFYQSVFASSTLYQEDFLAAHLRILELENECSKEARKDGKLCLGWSQATIVDPSCFARQLAEYRKEFKFSTIYLAMLLDRDLLIPVLQQYNFTVRTLDDIQDHVARFMNVPKKSLSGFVLSNLEQYICQRSKVFIYSTQSTWSNFVVESRKLINSDLGNFPIPENCTSPWAAATKLNSL